MLGGKTITAVLLAAGAGTRMQAETNKVFLSAGGLVQPVLYYPLAALEENPYIDDIILVCQDRDRQAAETLLRETVGRPWRITGGGETRSDSVRNALELAAGEIVLIHDGARPVLQQAFLNGCLEAMADCPGAIVAVQCIDTVCTVDEDLRLAGRVERRGLYQVQTPQCFHTAVLRECYEQITDFSRITDDSSLLEQCGYPVKIIPGAYTNIKLTVPTDMILVEQFLRYEQASGQV